MGCGSSSANNNADGPNAVSKNLHDWGYGEVKLASDAIVAGTDTVNVLIDCRSHEEVAESGTIPGAIVIPYDEMESALKLTPEEFQEKYHAKKFSIDNVLVVFCLRGMRSAKAVPILKAAGYEKIENFPGGWIEWSEETRRKSVAARKDN